MSRTKVFISYSHRDTDWLARVMEHVAALERWELITAWSDLQIEIGAAWEDEINAELAEAKVAVVLVSPAFLASKYVWEKEMRAIVKHTENGMQLLPLIVRPCAWKLERDLRDRQARPTGGRALSLGSDAQVDLDLAAFVYELAAIVGQFDSGAAAREGEKVDSVRDVETAAAASGVPAIDARSGGRRSSADVDLPRSWVGQYNGTLPFRLSITDVSGSDFRGEVAYRGETHRVTGSFSTAPTDIDEMIRRIQPTDTAGPLFSMLFAERRGSADPSDIWTYRAVVSEHTMVGRCYQSDRFLASFELESTT